MDSSAKPTTNARGVLRQGIADVQSSDGTRYWVVNCGGLPEAATTPGPVRRMPDAEGTGEAGHWVVTRHADVVAALSDARLSSASPSAATPPGDPAYDEIRVDQTMTVMDPPDHTRLRKLVVQAFSAKRVDALRPRIQRITDEVLDAAERDRLDPVETLAFQLPIRVVCSVLGIPEAVCEDLIAKTDTSTFPPAVPMKEVYAALTGLIAERRARPAGDLLSELTAAHDAGRLTGTELLHFGGLLFSAGHTTTVPLIHAGVRTILNHPGQLTELRDDPALLPPAVAEIARHVGTAVPQPRYTLEDVEIGGMTIPHGSHVTVGIMAANHDPEAFAAPDRFDIHRSNDTSVAFGYGIHSCLGARLAKIETEIAIGTLLRRHPRLLPDAP